jgi:hypothetical protein
MRKLSLKTSLAVFASAALLISAPASAAPVTVLTEGFDNIGLLAAGGWVMTNNSSPLGSTGWFQGITGVLNAQAGPANSYIAANFNNAASGGNISNWLITPELEFRPGVNTANFYTIVADLGFNDLIEVRISFAGPSTNVGSTTTSLGDFTTLTPGFALAPTWTGHSVDVSNGGATSLFGRIAFRYVVTNTDLNGDYVGIDTFSYRAAEASQTPVPEPMTLTLLASGLAGLAVRRRRA